MSLLLGFDLAEGLFFVWMDDVHVPIMTRLDGF